MRFSDAFEPLAALTGTLVPIAAGATTDLSLVSARSREATLPIAADARPLLSARPEETSRSSLSFMSTKGIT
jgi:hypothetical protein